MRDTDDFFSHCTLCPRKCGVNRNAGELGRCRVGADIRVARAAPHMWEEPPISGKNGSGTVFFSGCSLSCVFCQNAEISHTADGADISVSRLADIFLKLQEQGVHNINLVTAAHFIPKIIDALDNAKTKGLVLPVVYNSSGYESIETLRLLEGYVDVYLPDFKYMDKELAERYSSCKNYPEVAKAAISEMVRQTGSPVFGDDEMLRRGTVVRHLVLPGCVKDSKEIIHYLHTTYGNKIYTSIMSQYTPPDGMKERFPELARKLTTYEYQKVVEYARNLGVTSGFIQYGDAAKESFIPKFDRTGV